MQAMPYKLFALDESTTQSSNYMQLQTIDDTLRFTMYNPPMKNIRIFDIATGEMVHTIQLYKEGPHAIDGNVQGYYIVNKDTVYLYDYWTHKFILVNGKGEIMEKIDFSEQFLSTGNDTIPSSPYPSTCQPIRMAGNYMILQGMNDGIVDENTKGTITAVTALCDLSNKTIRFVNPYPEVYGKTKDLVKSWGVFSYRMVPYDLNDKGEMVLSYPADDHIHVYDISSNTTRRFFAGYSAKDKISPMTNPSVQVDLMQYLEQTIYAGIFFDTYHKLYYRLVMKPLKDYDLNIRETQLKEMSIIILNEAFEKIGEYDLKEKTGLYSKCFVSPEGLHINVLSDDDDYLKFITLKPVKLENSK
jgi:hypothetical protein